MVLFRVKFACNLTISNPVFRWESCKRSVWESVKKWSKLCSEAGTRSWISWVARGLQAARRCTWVKHAKKLNRHASCSTTGQKVQSGHSVILRLGLQLSQVARPSRQFTLLNWLFEFLSHSSIKTSYTHEILRTSRENFERESLEKNKINSSIIFT